MNAVWLFLILIISTNTQFLPPFDTCPAAKLIGDIREAYLKNYWDIHNLKKTYKEKQTTHKIDMKRLEKGFMLDMEKLERRNDRLRGLSLLDQVKVKDCLWHSIKNTEAQSGVYKLSVNDADVMAYCDMDTDSGGWTTILSRDEENPYNFNRSWNEYKSGFGSTNGNYWIGNDIIHELTKERPSELYFKLTNNKNVTTWAQYRGFTVGSEEENFVLNVNDSSHEGTAGDALVYGRNYYWSANRMAFTTYDRDNDKCPNCNCGNAGGWWLNKCGVSKLTGTQIYWEENLDWRKVKPRDDLKNVAMMIRFE